MRSRPANAVALSLLVGHLAFAGTAAAGPSPQEEANARVAHAATLAVEGKWAAAREEYESALTLVPSAVTLSSIAYCLEQEGQLVRAAERYRKALEMNQAARQPDASLEADLRRQLDDLMARIPVIVPPPAISDPPAPAPIALPVAAKVPPPVAVEVPPPGPEARRASPFVFALAGTLGVVGAALAANTYAQAAGRVDSCGHAPAMFTACWNDGRGAIHAEGTAAALTLALAGASAVTGAVLYFRVEKRGGGQTVTLAPSALGGSLLVRY